MKLYLLQGREGQNGIIACASKMEKADQFMVNRKNLKIIERMKDNPKHIIKINRSRYGATFEINESETSFFEWIIEQGGFMRCGEEN